jgi:hypothetical protein
LQPNLTQVIFLCVLILVSLWKFFRSSIIFFLRLFFPFFVIFSYSKFFFRFACSFFMSFFFTSKFLSISLDFFLSFSFYLSVSTYCFSVYLFFPISIHCFVFIFFFCCLLFCFRSCCIIDYCVRILMLQVMLLLRLQVIVPEVFEVTVCNCSEPLRTGISRPKFLQRTGLSSTVFYVHAETNQNTLLCVFG